MKNKINGIGKVLILFSFSFQLIPFMHTTYAIQTYSIVSDSMAPSIRIDDLISVDEDYPFNTLKIGDVIVFRAADPMEENKTIVARISAIIEKENNLTGDVVLCAPIAINEVIQEKTILTKGDANECSIPGIDFPITKENYVGKVIEINMTR